MTKPFSPRELVARVKAILRRTGTRSERRPRLSLHGVEVDLDRHRVMVDGQEVYLTAFEFKLLVALMEFPGRVFTREQLLAQVYAYDELYGVDRTIDVHVGKLRQKVELDVTRPERILTVRGVGYKFRESGNGEWVG
jgi:two-component system alkaline phosphatase synthesis response regulator PhoP